MKTGICKELWLHMKQNWLPKHMGFNKLWQQTKAKITFLTSIITHLSKDTLNSVAVLLFSSTSWRTECFYGWKAVSNKHKQEGDLWQWIENIFFHDPHSQLYKKKQYAICQLWQVIALFKTQKSKPIDVVFTLSHNARQLL
jgi:hypothetical protein